MDDNNLYRGFKLYTFDYYEALMFSVEVKTTNKAKYLPKALFLI